MTNIVSGKNEKTCTKCQHNKPTSEFYKKGPRLESVCKPCKREKRRQDYQLKFDAKGQRRLRDVMNRILDFSICRNKQAIEEINQLIEKGKTYEQ